MQSHTKIKLLVDILDDNLDANQMTKLINLYMQLVANGVVSGCNQDYQDLLSNIQKIESDIAAHSTTNGVTSAKTPATTADAKLSAKIDAAAAATKAQQVAKLKESLTRLQAQEPEFKKYAESTWGPKFDKKCPRTRHWVSQVMAAVTTQQNVTNPSIAQRGTFHHAAAATSKPAGQAGQVQQTNSVVTLKA